MTLSELEGGPSAARAAELVATPNRFAVAALLEPPSKAIERAGSRTKLSKEAPHIRELLARIRAGHQPDVDDLFKAWLTKRTKATIRTYRYDMKAFARFLGMGDDSAAAVRELLTWTEPEANLVALRWLEDMEELGWSPATKARRLSTLKSITKAAKIIGLLSWRLEIEGPTVEPFRDVRGPQVADVLSLLEHAGDGREGLRNRAMLLLMAVRGLRRIEVQRLRRRHFDRPGPRLQVFRKGRSGGEWLSLPRQVADAMGEWIDADAIVDADAPIFHPLQRPGEELNLDSVNGILRKIGDRAGIKVWPHALRHSALTIGTDVSGGDIRAVQQLAGHRNIQHTMRYIDNWKDEGGKLAQQVADELLGKEERE